MHIPQAINRDNMEMDPTTYMEYCAKLSSFSNDPTKKKYNNRTS
jgi:hypothetical protein